MFSWHLQKADTKSIVFVAGVVTISARFAHVGS